MQRQARTLVGGPRGPVPRASPTRHTKAGARDGRRSRVNIRTDVHNSMERLDREKGRRDGRYPWDPDFGESEARVEKNEDKRLDDQEEHANEEILPEEDEELIKHVKGSSAAEVDIESSRRKFEAWLSNFKNHERQFISPVVLCDVQYNEILEYTDGWQEPNILRTAACSVLFDKLVPCYALTRDSLLERLKNDLLYAVYEKFTPKVAASMTYFDHSPFFALADEAAKRQQLFDKRYEEMVQKDKLASTNKKIVKSVDSRQLDKLRWWHTAVVLNSWRDLIDRKNYLVSNLRAKLQGQSLQRRVRGVFRDWKLTTIEGQLVEIGQKVLYLEDQLEFINHSNPALAAEARTKAAATRNAVDIDLEELMQQKHEDNSGEPTINFSARRSLRWKEKLQFMYRNVHATAALSRKRTLDAISDIYVAKLKHNADRDAAGERWTNLPEFCQDLFLQQTGAGSNASKRLCELISGVRKWKDDHPRIKTFSYLVNANTDLDSWDPQAANFFLYALKHVMPDWLVLSRLFQDVSMPTVCVGDALRATELAFQSPFALGVPPVNLREDVRALAERQSLTESDISRVQSTNFVRANSSKILENDKTAVLLLDSWLELLMNTWIEQLHFCKRQTLDSILREQRLKPEEGGVITFSHFQSLLRDMKAGVSDSEIFLIYNETMDLTGRQQDKIVPEDFFEVCRNHGISYLGPK